jgi:outer membrane protein OmpA-like peptidoglycan-associated protein
MTATLDRPTRPASGRRRRRRREITRNLAIGSVVIAGIVGFLLAQEFLQTEPPRTLRVVAFEPREDLGDAASELGAQVAGVTERGADLLLVAILDGRDGTIQEVSFACQPGENRLACESYRTAQAERAEQGLESLLAAPLFPTVAPLAPLRQVDTRLAGLPERPDAVEVILNLTSRHTGALDPDGLGAAGRVDELVHELREAGELPDSCDGWQVHVVAEQSGEVLQDRAWEEVYRGAVESCGGDLVRFVDQWPIPGHISTLPPPPEIDTEEVTVERDIERRQDTFRLEETLFDTGSSSLRPGAAQVLDTMAAYIADLEGDWSIDIIGSADSVGDNDPNLALSQDRAQRVADMLLARLEAAVAEGADRTSLATRIRVEGIGSLPDDGSPEQRQRNRRVDIIVHHRSDGG